MCFVKMIDISSSKILEPKTILSMGDIHYMNNNEETLILLCPNCHSLTQTYKGANRNHGRKERKKYSK